MTPRPASEPTRPGRLVLVAGTATEVGKTWVTAAVAEILAARGPRVAARKPAQSFAPDDPQPTDAEVLARATGTGPEVVCPRHRWYPVPMAPPMAAERLGRPVPSVAELVAEVVWDDEADVGLVETAGGVASPQAADGAVPELVAGLAPTQIVLVADAGLGTINAVRLSLGALLPPAAGIGAEILVHLNRFDAGDDLHRANAAWLTDRDGVALTTRIPDLAARILGVPAPRG